MQQKQRNSLIIIVGISGAGKSTYIEKLKQTLPNVNVHSSDKLRGILFGDENCQRDPGMVFGILKRNVEKDVASGRDVIIDATNLNPRDRRDWITIADKYGAEKIAYVIERDKSTIMKHQEKRKSEGGRFVPEDAIDRMFSKYIRPDKSEGWDKIVLV